MNSTGKATDNDGLDPIFTVNITEDLRNKLLEFPKSKRWLQKKQEKSAMSYYAAGRNLVILQRATGQDPDSFLRWAKQQEEATDIQDRLDDIAKQLPTSEGYNFKNYVRGFLKSFGTQLPTADNTYTNQSDHPEYKKEEILKLLSYLQDKRHKLYVTIIAESGLRHHHVVQLKIRHLKEDLDGNIVPTAIRLDPEHYTGKKLAGHTFLGEESIKLLKECQEEGKIGKNPEDRVIPLQYSTLNETIRRAKKNARLDEKIQPSHGLRKYFEVALDRAGIDHEVKMRIEGHNNGTRGKAYTSKDWEINREAYAKAYPIINVHDPTNTKLSATIQEATTEMGQLREKLTEQDKKIESLTRLIRFLISRPLSPERNMQVDEVAQLMKDVGTVNPTPDPDAKSIYESAMDYLQRLTPEQRKRAFTQSTAEERR